MIQTDNIVNRVMTMYFQRLKDLRNDARKYQSDIAEYLHMQTEVYARYERGHREVPAWVIYKLALYYNTTADYILGLSKQRDKD